MKLSTMAMTIAEYCQQLENGQISINTDYQRSETVWPPAARSNLIETVLLGYPIPKFLLSQNTDLRRRTTHKEVVDGQQRTRAIREFFEGKFRITRGEFKGLSFKSLSDEQKKVFVEYNLSIDVFNSATDEEIREVFRRINSYHVPLNAAETRHARFQGEFKWAMKALANKWTENLVVCGVLKERQVSRMIDIELMTDLADLILNGVRTGTPTSRLNLYVDYDEEFKAGSHVNRLVERGMELFLSLDTIRNTVLVERENFLSLMGAAFWAADPKTKIKIPLRRRRAVRILRDKEAIESNLATLNEVLENDEVPDDWAEFKTAASEATNTDTNRTTRIDWFAHALTVVEAFEELDDPSSLDAGE